MQSTYLYESLAKEIVWKLKFGRTKAAAGEMAAIMAPLAPAGPARHLIVTHAPTVPARARQRGYDQAALIARSVARRAGLPYAPLLSRRGGSKQVGASRSERLLQVQDVFRPVRQGLILQSHVLLVDDVVTTGATLQEAAGVLHSAGAARVDAIVFARA